MDLIVPQLFPFSKPCGTAEQRYPTRVTRGIESYWMSSTLKITQTLSPLPDSFLSQMHRDDLHGLGVFLPHFLPSRHARLERDPRGGLWCRQRMHLCHQLDFCHCGFCSGIFCPLHGHVQHVFLHLPSFAAQGHPYHVSDPGDSLPPQQQAAEPSAAGEQGHADHLHYHFGLCALLAALLCPERLARCQRHRLHQHGLGWHLQDHHLVRVLQLHHQPNALRFPEPGLPTGPEEAAHLQAQVSGGHWRRHGFHSHVFQDCSRPRI